MHRDMRLLVALFSLSILLPACGGDDSPDAASAAADDLVPAAAGGKADSYVLEARVGGSYLVTLTERRSGAQTTPENARVLRFSVEPGQTIAAVARRADGGALDAYLRLFEDGEPVATSDIWQALVPMGALEDAAVVHTAGPSGSMLLFVSDRDLAESGEVQIDLVALSRPSPVDLTPTNPGLRALSEELRTREATLVAFIEIGALEEGVDGLLVPDLTALPSLKDRAQLNALVAQVNDVRQRLFRYFVEASLDEATPETIAAVGAICGELWGALRTPEHALDAASR